MRTRELSLNPSRLIQGHFFVEMGLIVAVVTITFSLFHTLTQRSTFINKQGKAPLISVQYKSAVETFLISYSFAELHYFKHLFDSQCIQAYPFLQAMEYGYHCRLIQQKDSNSATPKELLLFTLEDLTRVSNVSQDFLASIQGTYSYHEGCKIFQDQPSSCSKGSHFVVSIGLQSTQKFTVVDFKFYLHQLSSLKGLSEWRLVTEPHRSIQSFAVRSQLRNSLFLVQVPNSLESNLHLQYPDSESHCTSQQFSFETKCHDYSTISEVVYGLATYQNRPFTIKKENHTLMDLQAYSRKQPSQIDEDGLSSGIKVFPSYSKSALQGIVDFTLIGDQIYYLLVDEKKSEIGVLHTTSEAGRKSLCNLLPMGWIGKPTGISALPLSQPLLPGVETNNAQGISHLPLRKATFFLTTQESQLVSVGIYGFATSASNIDYDCVAMLNPDAQSKAVPFPNSILGFENADTLIPYFLF